MILLILGSHHLIFRRKEPQCPHQIRQRVDWDVILDASHGRGEGALTHDLDVVEHVPDLLEQPTWTPVLDQAIVGVQVDPAELCSRFY